LDNAQRVDPQVSYAKVPRNVYGVLEIARKSFPGQGCQEFVEAVGFQRRLDVAAPAVAER
jgi:hypothetical protein